MSNFLALAGTAYQGVKDEERREADDARRAAADGRATKDAAFQDEQRSRQRYDWSEVDRIRKADKADMADIRTKYSQPQPDNTYSATLDEARDQVAADKANPAPRQAAIDAALAGPDSSIKGLDDNALYAAAAAGPVRAAAGLPGSAGVAPLGQEVADKLSTLRPAGIPKPTDMANVLGMQAEFLRRKAARGDMSASDYAQQSAYIDKLQKEGVTDALALMNQGRYDEAMAKYNSTGQLNGARIISGEEGTTTLPSGETLPTHIVTIANPDGSRTKIDTAKTAYQLLDMKEQLASADRGRNAGMLQDYHQGALKVQQQQANTAEGYRADQAENMRDQRRLQLLGIMNKGSAPAAPIWTDKNDTVLEKLYMGTDPSTGAPTMDGSGMQFAKQVALATAKGNGGDAMSGIAAAAEADAKLKKLAGNDPDKLRTLRSQALAMLHAAPAARATAGPASPASFADTQAAYDADTSDRETTRRQILVDELDAERNKANPDQASIDMLTREIGRLPGADGAPAPANAPAADGTTVPNPFVAPAGGTRSGTASAAAPAGYGARPAAATTPSGMSLAERDRRMDLFNRSVGGANKARQATLDARREDAQANFDKNLAKIKQGMARADAQQVLSWFDTQAEDGNLSNQQLKQVREARLTARM